MSKLLPGAVTLHAVREADAEALAAALTRHRAYLRPWEPLRPDSFYTAVSQRSLLRAAVAEADRGRARFWLLWDGPRVVGRLSLTDVVQGAFRNGHLGYWVAQDYQGRGLATAAVAQACALAFSELGLHRLQAGTLVHNLGSQQVLLRNGFTSFGTAPQYLHIDGRWQDHLLFQRLNPDG